MVQRVKPDNSFAVYEKTGRFHNEEEGFFACFSGVAIKLCSANVMKFSSKILHLGLQIQKGS